MGVPSHGRDDIIIHSLDGIICNILSYAAQPPSMVHQDYKLNFACGRISRGKNTFQ